MKPKRIDLCILLVVTVTVCSSVWAETKAPNVVLIIGDDISAADFGCYGHPTIKTPNVDRLATRGARFTNAYLTISSCSPTRTSLISGRYPHNTGGPELHMHHNTHLAVLPQFPHELRKAGYHTALAGKTHFNGNINKSFDKRYVEGGESGAEDWVTALKERPKNKPFFMWFAARDAHRAWDMPLEQGPYGPDDVVVPPYHFDGKETRKDLAHYYNEIHRFDAYIGKVVDELEAQKVYENTVIIIMADNGRAFPRDKAWLYDSGIETPLVIHWPATMQNKNVCDSLVSIIDIAPTIMEITGIAKPKTFQGVSFLPLLTNPDQSTRDVVFAERNWHGQRYHERLVRYGDFTYIKNTMPEHTGFNIVHYGNQDQPLSYHELVEQWKKGTLNEIQKSTLRKPCPAEQLFNVEADPLQLKNLADNPEFRQQLTQLRNLLDQWTVETGDTAPPFETMTPDRNSRKTWKPVFEKGRPSGGIIPGQETKAWQIDAPGPIRIKQSRVVPHRIDVKHPGIAASKPQPYTLFQALDQRGHPVGYSMEVDSVVCTDSLCKVVKVTMVWDAVGVYQRYTLVDGSVLEKALLDDGDASPKQAWKRLLAGAEASSENQAWTAFSQADHAQLHQILRDQSSVLRTQRISDLTGYRDKSRVDAVSRATPLTLRKAVVEGASLSSYHLWHWANGEVVEAAGELTHLSCSAELLQSFLYRDEPHYVLFALDHLRRHKLFTPALVSAVSDVIRSGNNARLDLGLAYLRSALPDDDAFYDKLAVLFTKSNGAGRIYLLRFLEAEKAISGAHLDQMSLGMKDTDTYYELHLFLSLVEKHKHVSEQLLTHAERCLENENFFFARRAFWYLEKQTLNEQLTHRVEAFREQSGKEGRLLH